MSGFVSLRQHGPAPVGGTLAYRALWISVFGSRIGLGQVPSLGVTVTLEWVGEHAAQPHRQSGAVLMMFLPLLLSHRDQRCSH